MNRDTFREWLTGWLAKHPLRKPDTASPGYTTHVMAHIRSVSKSKRPAILEAFTNLTGWMSQPVPALALSTAVVLMVSLTLMRPHRQLRVVAEVDEDVRWIEETLDLLQDVDEAPEDSTDDSQAAEDVWQELQELDEAEWSLG